MIHLPYIPYTLNINLTPYIFQTFLFNLIIGGDEMKEKKEENKLTQETDTVGLDQNEQEMNGDYGMPETEYEDQQHKK